MQRLRRGLQAEAECKAKSLWPLLLTRLFIAFLSESAVEKPSSWDLSPIPAAAQLCRDDFFSPHRRICKLQPEVTYSKPSPFQKGHLAQSQLHAVTPDGSAETSQHWVLPNRPSLFIIKFIDL